MAKSDKIKYLKKCISEPSLYFAMSEESKGKALLFCLSELKSEKEEIILSFLKVFYPKAIEFIDLTSRSNLRTQIQIQRRDGGSNCPTCDQFAKEYKRNLSSNSATFLISLVREFEKTKDWVHYKNCKFSSRDYPALAYWGLAETKIDPDRKTRTNGMWKPTPEGISFAKGAAHIPRYVYTFNGKVTGFDKSEMIDISKALGQHFNYNTMMTKNK